MSAIPDPAVLAERAYARMANELREQQELGASRWYALGHAMKRIEPALIELAGERAEALEAIGERLSKVMWGEP